MQGPVIYPEGVLTCALFTDKKLFWALSGAADLLIFCTLSGPLIVNKMKQISASYLISFSSHGGKTANF